MMTLPRELSLKKGRLIQQPVRELEMYRRNAVFYTDVDVQERIQLPAVQGRCVDMIVTVRPSGGKLYDKFIIKVAKDTRFYTSIIYSPGESILTFDRSNSGLRRDIVSSREVVTRFRDGKIRLRIIMDRYSVEIFVNNGEQAISSTIFTEQSAEGISFECEGIAIIDVEKYDIVL
jgi:beta-fructofuranosidase